MKIITSFIVCLAVFTASFQECLAARQLALSKGPQHYAADMEFYYQKPRPEVIPAMLRNFTEKGVLANAEHRLMLAAFLSELSRSGKLNIEKLITAADTRDKDLRHTLAWSAHLAGAEQTFSDLTQRSEDKQLVKQITASPAKLKEWNLRSGKSVSGMYWAAFMASGNTGWLDALLSLALAYNHAKERGDLKNPDYICGSYAAATLYDYAPRHAAVKKKLEEYLNKTDSGDRDMLRLILDHAK